MASVPRRLLFLFDGWTGERLRDRYKFGRKVFHNIRYVHEVHVLHQDRLGQAFQSRFVLREGGKIQPFGPL